MARCQKCGAELPENGRFCEYCGSAAEISRTRSPDREAGPDYTEAGSRGGAVRFKRSSVIGMLLCSALTKGLYPSIWYVLRLNSLKKLDPAWYKNARWVITAFIAAHILQLCSAYNVFPVPQDFRQPIFYIFVFLWICASFAVRRLLRRYAERVSPGNPINPSIAASEFCLFLFGFLYLQTQVNRMIDARLLEAKL